MKENIDDLITQLEEWRDRCNFYKNEEARISDISQKYSVHKEIEIANKKIAEIEEIIRSIQDDTLKKDIERSQEETISTKTLQQAYQIFDDLKSRINYSSTREELEELEAIKAKIYNEFLTDYQEKINNTPNVNEHFVSILFDKIITVEKLDGSLINDINEVRSNRIIYKTHQRCLIVSALSLSLLNYKTIDSKKINILIDFLSDFEEVVWNKSLVGIVLSVLVHQNRISRFPDLINRLKQLQGIQIVQVGIYIIDKIIRNQLYKSVFFPEPISFDSFLSDKPYNWFLPFYENNNVINSAIENSEVDVDLERFEEFIYGVPLLDSLKYALSIAFEKGELRSVSEDKDIETGYKRMHLPLDSLYYANYLNPYFNSISEFFVYYKYYPRDKMTELFKSKITIAQTKLKDIILNKTQSLKLSADLHFEKQEYNSALEKLTEIDQIEPNQIPIISQIAECQFRLKYYSKAIKMFLKLIELDPNIYVFYKRLGACYDKINNNRESFKFYEKYYSFDPDDAEVLFNLATYYYDQKNSDKALEFCLKSMEISEESTAPYLLAGILYRDKNEHEKSISVLSKAIEIDPNDPDCLCELGLRYQYYDLQKALELCKKAFLLAPKRPTFIFSYARLLFEVGRYSEAEPLFNKVVVTKIYKEYFGVAYGNLGHIELFRESLELAMTYYKKCVLTFTDINVFEEKFDRDLEYAILNGVSKERYNEIKSDLIDYWSRSINIV